VKGSAVWDDYFCQSALDLSDDDIDDNWEIYRYRFLEGGLP